MCDHINLNKYIINPTKNLLNKFDNTFSFLYVYLDACILFEITSKKASCKSKSVVR